MQKFTQGDPYSPQIFLLILTVLFLVSCKPDGLRKRDADCKVTSTNDWQINWKGDKIENATQGTDKIDYEYNGNIIIERYNNTEVTYQLSHDRVVSSKNGNTEIKYEYNNDNQLSKIVYSNRTEEFNYSDGSVNQHITDGNSYPVSTYFEMYDICNLSVFQLLKGRTFLAFTHFGEPSIHPIKKGDYIGSYTYTIDDKNRIATCDGDYVEDFIPQCEN